MKLYGEPGWGSAIIEAQLTWYGLDYEFEAVGDLFESEDSRRWLADKNPVAQVPTLELDDGTIMTESAAMTLHLAETQNDYSLVPEPNDPQRAMFLRWLIFIVANIYPTYTYADEPSRFVPDENARQGFDDQVGRYGEKLYGMLEQVAGSPWFLGEKFSAIDIYIYTMSHWRPRLPWFKENAPRLYAIAQATKDIEKLKSVWDANFPEG